jgi:hypothetical protein
MALDLDIQRLLRTNDVKQIDFTMAGIRVSGHGFWALSNCFSDHPIRHRIRVTVRPEIVGPHADASYDPVDNKIHLRSNTVLQTASGRGAVVHECTHAQLDLRAVHTSIRSEEGAAFIAEAWYYLARGQNIAVVSPGFPADIVGITTNLRAQAARAIGAPVALTSDQINLARRAMVQLRYGTGHYHSDGIRGRRYRGP